MPIDATLMLILAIVFLATLVRSAFGFGEALIAVPLLALVMPVQVAAPLAVLLSVTVAAVILAQDWRHVHFRSAAWLVASTMLGIPLGLWLLVAAPEGVVKGVLGAVIVAFAAWSLRGRGRGGRRAELRDDRLAWAFGLGAGVLGGAYGMNGPPLVMYAALRRWSPQHFRATLQGYFLPASAVGLAGYAAAGLWTAEVTGYFAASLPVALVAVLLGRAVNRRMRGETFLRYVHAGLIVIGAVLLAQAVWVGMGAA